MQRSKSWIALHFTRFKAVLAIAHALLAGSILARGARADIIPDFHTFVLTNVNADGSVVIAGNDMSFVLIGGNNGSGLPGTTDFTATSAVAGSFTFSWSYSSLNQPGLDTAGYVIGNQFITLAGASGLSGTVTLAVNAGEQYGWWADTADNTGEPGILSVSLGSGVVSGVPEPGTLLLIASGLAALLAVRALRRSAWRGPAAQAAFAPGSDRRGWRRVSLGFANRRAVRFLPFIPLAMLGLALSGTALAQSQSHYVAVNVTGQLSLARVVNPSQIVAASAGASGAQSEAAALRARAMERRVEEANIASHTEFARLPRLLRPPTGLFGAADLSQGVASAASLPVASGGAAFGFNALSHYDQRNADSGNQLSIEPPNPSVAAANGLVLEGVNNAVRVFNQAGTPLLPTLSSNQWFGLPPALDRTTGIYGPYPTDMRVYFDSDIQRWFVLQRSQDNDAAGHPLDSSHIYLAVSASADPTGPWNVYVMDTTNASNPGCPCVSDYPQIGSDQYGFYISANEYNAVVLSPVDSTILAISKSGLRSGALTPAAWRFTLPLATGFEFAIQPASTPPGASKFVADGGVEYFVSSQSMSSSYSQLALWALSNSASIDSTSPALLLTQTFIQTNWYYYPGVATQKPGPIPYGMSLSPPATLEFIDGNIDSRVQSVVYAQGRLFITLPTQVLDAANNSVVGAFYAILSPTFRSQTLAATVLQQGYLSVTGNHILRPAVSVTAQSKGAIVFTLVGPDYFPSAAFTPIGFSPLDPNAAPSIVQIAAPGTAPEDGFSGYPPNGEGVARWGDYSTAVTSDDGSIWMTTEYIPGGPRTVAADWGTFISQYVP